MVDATASISLETIGEAISWPSRSCKGLCGLAPARS
jgi:hypothetical protein